MKYFVLKPKGKDAYAKASRLAMRAYAQAIEGENDELCDDLFAWVWKEEDAAQFCEPLPKCGACGRPATSWLLLQQTPPWFCGCEHHGYARGMDEAEARENWRKMRGGER